MKKDIINRMIADARKSGKKVKVFTHRQELIPLPDIIVASDFQPPIQLDDWRETLWISKNALIITAIFDKVQFMYWPNQWSVYANDVYYQPTLGLDGIE